MVPEKLPDPYILLGVVDSRHPRYGEIYFPSIVKVGE